MNKKGISPLIATVLIIGFTIVLAVLVITWITETVKTQTDTADSLTDANTKCLALLGGYSETFTYSSGAYHMSLVNIKSNPFDFHTLWLGSSDGSIGNSSTVSVAGYESVTVTSNDVSQGDYSKVKIIPFFIVDGKEYECGTKEIDIELSTGGAAAMNTYYYDGDGDSYGNPSVSQNAQTPPLDYVSNGDDCDDTNEFIYPSNTNTNCDCVGALGAVEICSNGIDEDCTGADLVCPHCDWEDPITFRCICDGAVRNSGICCNVPGEYWSPSGCLPA